MKILLFVTFTISLVFCDIQKNARIIGGSVARAGEFPSLAAIYTTTADSTHFCGGSLVNQRWILTAGQCVDGATLFNIYLGTIDIKTPSETSLRLATEDYVLHPDYNPNTLENDIGLIKLRLNIQFSDYIGAGALAFADLVDSTSLLAVGWGQTSNDSPIVSDELHTASVVTISNQECKLTYGNQVGDNMVCVAGSYNEGACHGDAGSPVFYVYRGGVLYHEGVSSFVSGNGCESTDPSGYTKTWPYVDWIKNVTSDV